MVSQLKAVHHQGQHTMGLDMENGSIADIAKLGITESFKVKSRVLTSAAEAAEMILRVDEIVKSAPRYPPSSFSLLPIFLLPPKDKFPGI